MSRTKVYINAKESTVNVELVIPADILNVLINDDLWMSIDVSSWSPENSPINGFIFSSLYPSIRQNA